MAAVELNKASFLGQDPFWSVDNKAVTLLRHMFDAVVGSADPAKVLADHLPEAPAGRCVVVGAGKAAAAMAAAVEAAWQHVDLTGRVVVPYGYGMDCHRIQVCEAGHPLPDANSIAAAEAIFASVKKLHPDDLVLALFSGGGSSVMCLPAPGLTLEDKQLTNKALLMSGLDIRTMNAVRRRVSAIKGGKLAAAVAPARLVTLAISDIPGDDPSAIASGPTVADSSTNIDFGEVVAKLGSKIPARVAELLTKSAAPCSRILESEIKLIATPAAGLEAAAKVARACGVKPINIGDQIEGESRVVAKEMAKLADTPVEPTVLISGGETTVTLDRFDAGCGGSNTEFLLGLVCELNSRPGVWALAADTDGLDGTNLRAAGAIATPDTIRRALDMNLDPAAYLDRHDSGTFFGALGDLVITGPTRTNINDFRAILIVPAVKP